MKNFLPSLHFPEVKTFDELFESVRPMVSVSDKKSGERYVNFVSFEPHKSGMYGKLKPKYETFIKEQMNSIVPDDNIYVSVVCRDDGTALITFQYNSIIGSRWVTIVSQETLPK
jgi:hypothetical protein